jgi:hypothetical protein
MESGKRVQVCILTEAKHLALFSPLQLMHVSEVEPGGHK